MGISDTTFSVKEAATALGCCAGNTSRKLARALDRLEMILDAAEALQGPDGRADNLAELVTATVESLGKLATFDRQRFREVVEERIRRRRECSPPRS